VIAILVQPANLDILLLPFELAFHNMIIGAAVHLDAETTIDPQLCRSPLWRRLAKYGLPETN
jgi:hypothetical protein